MFAMVTEPWLGFGKSYRDIQVHTIYSYIYESSPLSVIPVIYIQLGCDLFG